jgi:hypothetical protein
LKTNEKGREEKKKKGGEYGGFGDYTQEKITIRCR